METTILTGSAGRSVTAGTGTSSRQAALVRAIVELCRSLGLETVAEGVGSAAQARQLLRLGYTLAQGFHLGRGREREGEP